MSGEEATMNFNYLLLEIWLKDFHLLKTSLLLDLLINLLLKDIDRAAGEKNQPDHNINLLTLQFIKLF